MKSLTKQNNSESRSTLDAIHNEKIKDLLHEKCNLDKYKQDIGKLRVILTTATSCIDTWHIENQIEELEKNIKYIESGNNVNDYLLRSGDILFDYYDMENKIKNGTKCFKQNKAKPGSILAMLNNAAKEEGIEKRGKAAAAVQPISTVQRNDLLNKYLSKEYPNMTLIEGIQEDVWTQCDLCNSEMSICMNEAYLYCNSCGHQEFVLIDSDKPSYKDPPREVSYYAYKKINHFNEWLAQFQAKESTEIPQEIYDNILIQLKKERITAMSSLKVSKLREVLRNMKCSKYYEHIPHIINRLNGQKAPFMNRENEERLRHMFREIQPAFKKHCPKGRRNFLSYSYVLYKFCELLEMDDFLGCFSLLKNREKLLLQDKTWQKICEEMQWQFIRTV